MESSLMMGIMQNNPQEQNEDWVVAKGYGKRQKQVKLPNSKIPFRTVIVAAQHGQYMKTAGELFTFKWLILCNMNFNSSIETKQMDSPRLYAEAKPSSFPLRDENMILRGQHPFFHHKRYIPDNSNN